MEWDKMLTSEIEVKLKTMEFQYNKLQSEINQIIVKMDYLNKSYIEGKKILEERISNGN